MTTTIKKKATIPADLSGYRFDRAVAILFPDYSRSRLKKWIQSGELLIDGRSKLPREMVSGGETVSIKASLADEAGTTAESLDIPVVYEDEDILVVNKPAGVVVHPGAGISSHTLLNALLYRLPQLSELPRGGIVHRLDKDTSGLLVIAKNLSAHTFLVQALQKHAVEREYVAIVMGTLTGGGVIDAPIGRHATYRTKMAISESGRKAVTHYRILERFKTHTAIAVRLETGRTHQIRVHLAHIYHPLVGDRTYCGRMRYVKGTSDRLQKALSDFGRQALHAKRLRFIHPRTQQWMECSSELPQDMQQLLTVLREESTVLR